MKAIVIGALAATAFAETAIIVYPGTYKAGAPTGTDCCAPDASGVTVTQAADGKVSASWKFTAGCTGAKGANIENEQFTGAATTPASGAVTWASASVGGETGDVILKAPTNANGDFSLDMNGLFGGAGTCTVALSKKPATTPSFPGVYTVSKKLGTEANCCYPTGDVILRTVNTNDVKADFTFATCTGASAAFSGDTVSQSGTPDTDTKQVSIVDGANTYTLDPSPVVDASLVLGLSPVSADCAAVLTKKTLPTLTYNKVFEVDTESSATGCCYPAGEIIATQDSTTKKVTLAFTYESDCTPTVKGKTVSAVGDVDTVTGNVDLTDTANTLTYTLVAPQTATGDWSLDLSDIATGCSAVLDTKSGYVLGLGSLVALSLSYIMF